MYEPLRARTRFLTFSLCLSHSLSLSSLFLSSPHVQFVERYKGTKLERARDLFEQCLADKLPEDHAKMFYMMYASLEEKHGLVRRAMAVYDRAARAVQESDRISVYRLYIRKVEEFYGVTKTREVYERAVEALPDGEARDMCLQFSQMERKLGEVDRARGILSHGSQFADPRRAEGYWKSWHDFEVQHGNEDTFREMLRIKRSVQAKFMSSTYYADNITETDLDDAGGAKKKAEAAQGGGEGGGVTPMDQLERDALQAGNGDDGGGGGGAGGGSGGGGGGGGRPSMQRTDMADIEKTAATLVAAVQGGGDVESAAAVKNTEEIDLDDDSEDDEEDVDTSVKVTQRSVPAGVFGAAAGLAAAAKEGEADSSKRDREDGGGDGVQLGALERFKRQKGN